MRIFLALLVAAAVSVPELVRRVRALDDRPQFGWAESYDLVPVGPRDQEFYLVTPTGRVKRTRAVHSAERRNP